MNGLLTDRWPAARRELFALHAKGDLRVVFDDQVFDGPAPRL